jgi:RNA polymerase sigma-70 factor (ECF subfamily)
MPPADRADRRLAFPSTRWSRILAPEGGRDLQALALAYAGPIRAWLAARLRLTADQADDVGQEAFAWLLHKDLLQKADPTRGRFRAFLKTALANFAIERVRHAKAQKRGGGQPAESLALGEEPIDAAGRTPDQVLDEQWRAELLTVAQQRLQAELEAAGKAVHWALFRDLFLGAEAPPSHAELAARYGISRNDVANWLDHGKRRYRALLREAVADTVRDEAELAAELQWLFGPVREVPR